MLIPESNQLSEQSVDFLLTLSCKLKTKELHLSRRKGIARLNYLRICVFIFPVMHTSTIKSYYVTIITLNLTLQQALLMCTPGMKRDTAFHNSTLDTQPPGWLHIEKTSFLLGRTAPETSNIPMVLTFKHLVPGIHSPQTMCTH